VRGFYVDFIQIWKIGRGIPSPRFGAGINAENIYSNKMPPSSSMLGGVCKPVTVTARLVLEAEHVLTLEGWIGQELVRSHGRVKDERILYAGSCVVRERKV